MQIIEIGFENAEKNAEMSGEASGRPKLRFVGRYVFQLERDRETEGFRKIRGFPAKETNNKLYSGAV